MVALTVLLRLVHLWQVSDDVFFDAPVIDARLTVDDARYLLDEHWAGPAEPYWKPPLYTYVVAVTFALFGEGAWAPRLLQVGFDALTVLLVFGLGRRLFSERIGLAAAALTALSGSMIYFTGELVSASFAVVLDTAALYALVATAQTAGAARWRWAGCGALLGAAALVRPEMLLFAALVIGWAVRRGSWARGALVAAGVVALVAPVTVRNAVRGGDPALISSNGGINLYIGTHPAYRGIVGIRPGPEWERLMREPEAEGVTRLDSRHSAYYTEAALRLIADDPVGTAGRALGKAAVFFHGHELPSNLDPYRLRGESVVLRALLWEWPCLPFGVIAPLGVVGMVLVVARRHPARGLVVFVAVQVLVAMIFFVTARYRMPVVPILALLACHAAAELWRARRAGDRRLLLGGGAAVAALAAFASSGAFAGDRAWYARQIEAEEHHYRGTVLFAEHRAYPEAVAELRRAAALEPARASTHYNLGLACAALGDDECAFAAMRRAIDVAEAGRGEEYLIDPAFADMMAALARRPSLRATPLGAALDCLARRQLDCAIDGFDRAGDRGLAGLARLARGEERLGRGDHAGAAADLERAAADRPNDPQPPLLLGLARHRAGDPRAAEAFAEFRRRDWPRGHYFRSRPPDADDRELVEALGGR